MKADTEWLIIFRDEKKEEIYCDPVLDNKEVEELDRVK